MELVWEEEGEEHSVEIGPDRPSAMLGRVAECDIRVARTSVSRRHALFTWSNGSVVVTDQGSTAGTYIDGKKITRSRVEVGTVVNCGGVMVLLDEPAAKKPAASARKTSRDAGGDWAAESTHGGGGGSPPAKPKGGKDLDLDSLFDGPMPSRRGGDKPKVDAFSTPAAEPPKKKSGFDANDFFAAKADDDGFDDFPAPAPSKRLPEPEPVKAAPAPTASAKAHLACYLLYIDDDGADAEIRVERDRDPVLVGRREGASLKVHNPSVSGKHATVGWKDEEVEVRDLGSSNGTFINGERVRRGVLNDGDVLRCGRFELRVSFVEHKAIAQAEYEEWGDDWADDELDPGQPNYYIVYRDNRNQLTGVIMGEREKRLAVGSKGCEINIEARAVEAEHCELEWDEGVLLVKDLKSETGTFVNDEAVEGDETLRNGDVIVVGRARLRIVRGTSDDMEPPRPEKRSDGADLWARHLENRDDDLELLFIDGEVDDDGGRHELSLWGNGECRIETHTAADRHTATGMIDRDLRKILFDGILKAGFPDAKTKQTRSGEVPAELNLFQDRDEAKVSLSKKLTQRSPSYHEVLEVLRAIALELSAR
jgi:pSer/pThr/pTyr-binding forkhead associated (FHA) protein